MQQTGKGFHTFRRFISVLCVFLCFFYALTNTVSALDSASVSCVNTFSGKTPTEPSTDGGNGGGNGEVTDDSGNQPTAETPSDSENVGENTSAPSPEQDVPKTGGTVFLILLALGSCVGSIFVLTAVYGKQKTRRTKSKLQ